MDLIRYIRVEFVDKRRLDLYVSLRRFAWVTRAMSSGRTLALFRPVTISSSFLIESSILKVGVGGAVSEFFMEEGLDFPLKSWS